MGRVWYKTNITLEREYLKKVYTGNTRYNFVINKKVLRNNKYNEYDKKYLIKTKIFSLYKEIEYKNKKYKYTEKESLEKAFDEVEKKFKTKLGNKAIFIKENPDIAEKIIFTGCIDEKTAYKSISWPTIIIVAGAMGFSKGLQVSGAGDVIANSIINLCGPIGQSPFGLCIVFFILGSLLSNMLSDNASVSILIPIVIGLAQRLNCDPMPLILATASGIKVAVATPISVTPMTMVQVAGYRFKDYLRMGGLVNLTALLITSIAIYVIYF